MAQEALRLAVAGADLLQTASRKLAELPQQASGDLVGVIWIVGRLLITASMLCEVNPIYGLPVHTEDDPGPVGSIIVMLLMSDIVRKLLCSLFVEIANRVVVVACRGMWQQPVKVGIMMGAVVRVGVKTQLNPVVMHPDLVGKPVEQLETVSGHRLAKLDPLQIVDIVELLYRRHAGQVQEQSHGTATQNSSCHPRHPAHTVW